MIEYSNFSSADKTLALHHFENKCCYCGVTLNLKSGFDNSVEFDHHISIKQQWLADNELVIDGTVHNRVPSCRKCNRAKKDKDPVQWVWETFKNAQEILDNIELYFALQQEYLFN